MHDPLHHLRPGAGLDLEVVHLVRRQVVQVHLEEETKSEIIIPDSEALFEP